MNRIDYDIKRKEITITGCINCPFCHYYERNTDYGPFCSLDEKIKIENLKEEHSVIKNFPDDCSLRDPNFKLTRIFK